MRPCPTCDCFVPVAARRCPRCEAALEPICEETGAERDSVLVGANGLAAALAGSSRATDYLARVALPPLDGPAGRPRRPSLPKLPQPFAPDPLVLAVFLGIPPVVAEAPVTAAPVSPVDPAPDTFGALLGTSTTTPTATTPTPTAKPTGSPEPAPAGAPAVVALPVAVPLAESNLVVSRRRAPSGRRRFSRADPFGRSSTRRERVLTRLCMALAVSLAVAVVVLRLPLGARPELGASSIGTALTSSTLSSPFDAAVREQTRTDLQAVVGTARRFYPVWRSYTPATAVLLNGALPQFGFVTRTQPSLRVGEISVAGSAHVLVLAEYAGPGRCAFARVVDLHTATTTGAISAPCVASSTPQHGWTALNP